MGATFLNVGLIIFILNMRDPINLINGARRKCMHITQAILVSICLLRSNVSIKYNKTTTYILQNHKGGGVVV